MALKIATNYCTECIYVKKSDENPVYDEGEEKKCYFCQSESRDSSKKTQSKMSLRIRSCI